MTIEERQKIAKSLMEEALHMSKSRWEDSLANFKSNADRLGVTQFQVWAVYFNKRIDAINNSIKASPERPTLPLHGIIIEAIIYLSLLDCLIREDLRYSK